GRVEPNIPPVPTTFFYVTFSDAAAEAGLSRLFGGIHFEDDNTTGQDVGYLIGLQAWAKALTFFNGTARGVAGGRGGPRRLDSGVGTRARASSVRRRKVAGGDRAVGGGQIEDRLLPGFDDDLRVPQLHVLIDRDGTQPIRAGPCVDQTIRLAEPEPTAEHDGTVVARARRTAWTPGPPERRGAARGRGAGRGGGE